MQNDEQLTELIFELLERTHQLAEDQCGENIDETFMKALALYFVKLKQKTKNNTNRSLN
jgi:hypothetical protein